MRIIALLIVALAASPSCADPFELDLEAFRTGLAAEIRTSGVVRRATQGLTPEEVRRKVEAALDPRVPAGFVDEAFRSPLTRPLEGIEDRFGRAPERNGTYEQYRRYFMTEERIAAGARFLAENHALLDEVERRTGVDRGLLTAFVGVETFYGRKAGTFGVFNALYTITMKVQSRSDWAAKELAAYLKFVWQDGFAVHSILGSYAGAFGYGQFIPSSWNAYSVDFDGDGKRSHDRWPDVLGSVANYVVRHNYEPGGAYDRNSRNWWAIYAYNHSEFYVRVVIELRAAVLARAASLAKRPAGAPRHG